MASVPGVREELALQAKRMGIEKPTDIQCLAIPHVASSPDASLIQSGPATGKTMAFLLPILSKLEVSHLQPVTSSAEMLKPTTNKVQAVIICHSPELCMQVYSAVKALLPAIVPEFFLKTMVSALPPGQSEPSTLPIDAKEEASAVTVSSARVRPPLDDVVKIMWTEKDAAADNEAFVQRPPAIVIAQPKRLKEMLDQPLEKLDQALSNVKYLVVDEADRVLKPLGRFANDKKRQNFRRHAPESIGVVNRLYQLNPKQMKLVCVGSTLNARLRSLLHNENWQVSNPSCTLRVGLALSLPDHIEHYYALCKEKERFSKLVQVLKKLDPPTAMLVLHDEARISSITASLRRQGIRAVSLHEHMRQTEEHRRALIELLRQGSVRLLVATESAARGLDLGPLTHVFLAQSSHHARAYYHMAGRVGRRNAKGHVITILSYDEIDRMDRIYGWLQLKNVRNIDEIISPQ